MFLLLDLTIIIVNAITILPVQDEYWSDVKRGVEQALLPKTLTTQGPSSLHAHDWTLLGLLFFTFEGRAFLLFLLVVFVLTKIVSHWRRLELLSSNILPNDSSLYLDFLESLIHHLAEL